MAQGRRWKATIVVEFYTDGEVYHAEDYLMQRIEPLKDIIVWKSMPRIPDAAEEQKWADRRNYRSQAQQRSRGWWGGLISQLTGR
jgi:hypothetical protein